MAEYKNKLAESSKISSFGKKIKELRRQNNMT